MIEIGTGFVIEADVQVDRDPELWASLLATQNDDEEN